MGFVGEKADIGKNVGVLREVVRGYREVFPGVKCWGALGLCWGGKVGLFPSFGVFDEGCADDVDRSLFWPRARGRRSLLLHRFIRGKFSFILHVIAYLY